MLIAIFIFVFAVLVFIVFKQKENRSLVEKNLLEQEKHFSDLVQRFYDDTEYLRFSKFMLLKDELLALKNEVQKSKNIFNREKTKILLNSIYSFEDALSDFRKNRNEEFYRKEKERAKHIFSDENGRDLLTDEQLKAVLCNDDRNLVIAGAGSGKTVAIVAFAFGYQKLVCKDAITRGALISTITFSISAIIPGPVLLGLIPAIIISIYLNKKLGEDFKPTEQLKRLLNLAKSKEFQKHTAEIYKMYVGGKKKKESAA